MQFAGPAEQYNRFMGRYAATLAPALADAGGGLYWTTVRVQRP